MVYYGLIKISC